jgi:hypothetical protein
MGEFYNGEWPLSAELYYHLQQMQFKKSGKMEKLTTKVSAVCMLLAFMMMSSCGQGYSKSDKDSSQSRTKLDKSKVPKNVTDAFYGQYPLTTRTFNK